MGTYLRKRVLKQLIEWCLYNHVYDISNKADQIAEDQQTSPSSRRGVRPICKATACIRPPDYHRSLP